MHGAEARYEVIRWHYPFFCCDLGSSVYDQLVIGPIFQALFPFLHRGGLVAIAFCHRYVLGSRHFSKEIKVLHVLKKLTCEKCLAYCWLECWTVEKKNLESKCSTIWASWPRWSILGYHIQIPRLNYISFLVTTIRKQCLNYVLADKWCNTRHYIIKINFL